MRRSFRSTRRLAAVGVVAGLAVLALLGTASAPAATNGAAALAAAHKCLVMTGSGDPAFVKNFNPYTATGLPSGSFVQGAFYEPLIVIGEGGLKPVPWLARTWKWSNGNKTLTLKLAHGVKWSDGKPLTSLDVVYSLTAGQQNAAMDRIGLTGAGNNVQSIRAHGPYTVAITLKTPDSQFIAGTLNRQFIVPQHIWSKVADPATFTNSNPVGSGPFDKITRFTTQDYVFSKNPNYWQPGLPKIPLPRVRPGRLERQRARADPERPGRLDAQLRPERRTGVYRPRIRSISTRSMRRRRTRRRSSSTTRSTRTASSPSARRSASRSTGTRCRSSASTGMGRPPMRSGSNSSSRAR